MHKVPHLLWVITINDNNIIHDDSNEEACIESSGFCVPRPDINYKGSFIGGCGLSTLDHCPTTLTRRMTPSNNDALGISIATVDDNNKKWNKEEAENTRTRPYSCISI